MELDIKTIIDAILLLVLLSSSGWLFSVVSKYGGPIGKSFKTIGWGSLLMASSHLIEVFTFYLPLHDSYSFMFLHRLLATVGFVIIAYGFKTLIGK